MDAPRKKHGPSLLRCFQGTRQPARWPARAPFGAGGPPDIGGTTDSISWGSARAPTPQPWEEMVWLAFSRGRRAATKWGFCFLKHPPAPCLDRYHCNRSLNSSTYRSANRSSNSCRKIGRVLVFASKKAVLPFKVLRNARR
jgi:hypothetical protein